MQNKTVRLTETQLKRLAAIQKKTGLSESDLIRTAIHLFTENYASGDKAFRAAMDARRATEAA